MNSINVIKLSKMNIDDLAHSSSFAQLIEMREDIILACKKLNIKNITVFNAQRISQYLNEMK